MFRPGSSHSPASSSSGARKGGGETEVLSIVFSFIGLNGATSSTGSGRSVDNVEPMVFSSVSAVDG